MRNSVFSVLTERQRQRRRWRQHLAFLMNEAILEPHRVEITHQKIEIPKLPRAFAGYRIVQLSDIHHSAFLEETEIAEAVRLANQLKPDLFALTGDYISHSRDYIPGVARALGSLQARDGVFAVLGNHDHWTDGEMMQQALTREGIRVLDNEKYAIERHGAEIKLLGIDDMMVKRDDLRAAIAGTTRDETRILLSHNPRIIRKAARAGLDLVLSGHTHGGQINWRLLTGRQESRTARWLRRPSRRLMRGYAKLKDTHIYVNRGLGTVVLPLRYGCPPEITLIELV